MILVTGATGTIGSEVLRLLTSRGEEVRAMTRNPSRIPAGVDVVRADFEHPETLRAAVDGVTTVFLATAPGSWIAGHDLALLEAASAAGVAKVVKLSAIGTDTRKDSWHAPGEEALRAGDPAWTILRPSGFASNTLRWAENIRAGHPVPNMTGTGTQTIVDPRDVAAAAVETLLSPDHNGRTYTLTGPGPLSVEDQAAQLADVLGRKIETVDVPAAQAKQQMLAAGYHESVAETALAGFEIVRSGGAAPLTDDVEHLLHRPPGTFHSWAEDHRELFTALP